LWGRGQQEEVALDDRLCDVDQADRRETAPTRLLRVDLRDTDSCGSRAMRASRSLWPARRVEEDRDGDADCGRRRRDASALAEALTADFGNDRISLWGDRPELEVRVEGGLDRTVLRVLDTVDNWLDQVGFTSAEMWLGERSYRVERSTPVELWQ
jgi:hypothetical protein